ncbi:hypothetical protein AMTRI_Chr09g39450 [Amborella trichopoda]|uniref:F-box protein n=1 Tax=Amborella trichopoda TaxID=13333 RepID=W1PU20_AMBTC|nr:uncharacterized protein LOC18438967 [Amborella trichopoda]XP_020525848.1 uncharacterized protein LOC18438967 [Amborella trichopoda]ERN10785.1 hypothetical protein AMTR_s00027p00220530 [Amborella trichopoda]|eukprot:XP_006849204.1 uncharacterized protein LOC18438967 [Amborella trichopoda]
MENLPLEIAQKIFVLLEHHHLATAQQVCRKWRSLASDNLLWCILFEKRWGQSQAAFYNPVNTKCWKDAYEVHDRRDRVGWGLKIIREGNDYFLIHQGEIQRHLGSRVRQDGRNLEKDETYGHWSSKRGYSEGPCPGILDKILFFIGDLEVASRDIKRHRRSPTLEDV